MVILSNHILSPSDHNPGEQRQHPNSIPHTNWHTHSRRWTKRLDFSRFRSPSVFHQNFSSDIWIALHAFQKVFSLSVSFEFLNNSKKEWISNNSILWMHLIVICGVEIIPLGSQSKWVAELQQTVYFGTSFCITTRLC